MSDLGQPTRTKTNPKDKSLASKKALKHIVGFLLTIWQICFSLYRLKCRHHLSLPIPAFSKYFLSFLTLSNLSQIVGLLNIPDKWTSNTLPFFMCEKSFEGTSVLTLLLSGTLQDDERNIQGFFSPQTLQKVAQMVCGRK